MLQGIFSSSVDCHLLVHECKYLTTQMELFAHWKRIDNAGFIEDFFGDMGGLRDYTRLIIGQFLLVAKTNLKPKKYLVLKNPELTPYFPELAEILPLAGFAVIVRDPRDIVASMLRVAERARKFPGQPFYSAFGRDMEKFSNHLKSYYVNVINSCQAKSHNIRKRTFFVKYENLVGNTDSTLGDISRFFEIDLRSFDKEKEWNTIIDFEKRRETNAFCSDLYGKAISSKRIGDYREVLTEQEVSDVEKHCADYMKLFRYQ